MVFKQYYVSFNPIKLQVLSLPISGELTKVTTITKINGNSRKTNTF